MCKCGIARSARNVTYTASFSSVKNDVLLTNAIQQLATYAINAVVIASVNPPICRAVNSVVRDVLPRCQIQKLTHKDYRARMPIDIPEETAVGVDRCANAYALYLAGKFPAISVDCGTAITCEVLDADGHFCGGSIGPGVALKARVLAQGTAALPEYMVQRFPNLRIGKTTQDALHIGIHSGVRHAVCGIVREAAEAIGEPFRKVIVTGGARDMYAKALRQDGQPARAQKDLTLRGIAAAYYG